MILFLALHFENKVGISSFLRYQTHRIIKGNAKSKILFLTHDLSTFSDLQKIADEMEKSFKSKKLGVSVKGKSFELQGRTLSDPIKSINEYRDLLHMIFNYAMGNIEGLDLAIGNSMRRALEAFSTFIYGTGIAEVSFDPKVIKSLGNILGILKTLCIGSCSMEKVILKPVFMRCKAILVFTVLFQKKKNSALAKRFYVLCTA